MTILHEWTLDDNKFDGIVSYFGVPDIDIFASRLNEKCRKYASWKPDPDAEFIDAFSHNGSELTFYAVPPFSIINPCLQKIPVEEA